MRSKKWMVSTLVLLSVVALFGCSEQTQRTVTARIPNQIPVQGTPSDELSTQIIPDFCNYNAPVVCVAVASDGSEEVLAVPDDDFLCTMKLARKQTYQLFLRQNEVNCAEVLQSVTLTPMLIGKSDLDFDCGQLTSWVNGSLHTTGDPELNSDSDGDFIADAFDADMDGNGVEDLEEDCDQDGLTDKFDADVDGDAVLNADDTELDCIPVL